MMHDKDLNDNKHYDDPDLIECPECKGSRFTGYGTGYDCVCDSCSGYRTVSKTLLEYFKNDKNN